MHISTHGMPGNTAGNHFSEVLPYCHHIAHNNSNESKWDPFIRTLNFRHAENSRLDKLHKYSGCTNCSISLWPKSCVKKFSVERHTVMMENPLVPRRIWFLEPLAVDILSSAWQQLNCFLNSFLNYPHAAYHKINYYYIFWDKCSH
jgi:hypothetical protein